MDKFKPEQLQFSDVAISHFSGLLKKEKVNQSIRIGVKKAGCSGYEYFFEYEETHAHDDTVIKHDDCTFLIDPKSFEFLKGSKVDYEEDGFNKGIKFHNPNATSVCGCGESFTVDSDKNFSSEVTSQVKKKIKILPHEEFCPEGAIIEALPGESILEACLRSKIKIEHACEMSCACTTCHIIIEDGFNNLEDASDEEEDQLDKAWGLEQNSRLGCQAYPVDEMTVIRIPKYTINLVSEDH